MNSSLITEPAILWQCLPPMFEGEISNLINLELDDMPPEEAEAYKESLKLFSGDFNQKEYAKGVVTQAGIIPINDNFNPFDFWFGHTNFIVSHSIRSIIKKTPGIEFMFPVTPYRFKIAIGRYWVKNKQSFTVLKEIETRIKKFFKILEL